MGKIKGCKIEFFKKKLTIKFDSILIKYRFKFPHFNKIMKIKTFWDFKK